jgi:hypothetical protein
MLPVPQDVLKRLHLGQAVDEEAKGWQSLVPAAPGSDRVTANATGFARWLEGQLRAGMSMASQVVVSARKGQVGVRPVPVWGFAERVAYRALVNFLLRNEPELDRSPEAYLQFIGGPVGYARKIEPPSVNATVGRASLSELVFPVRSSVIRYVVKADISAFYEYIDHGILGRELLARTGEYSTIECLMSLLAEVQGRAYGLPQLLDPSDRLSELYIDIVERDVLRRGWPTWRFNDDFRIAARDYGAALAAIEDLAAAAREVGLILSDMKTTTPKFSTYALENFGLQIDDELPADLHRHDPADFVGDYLEVAEADPAWAVQLIRDANIPDCPAEERTESGIDLGNVRGEDFRQLRRALGHLKLARVGDALPYLVKLVVYVPSLTPWAIRYVIATGEQDHQEQAADVLAGLVAHVSLSDWQRVWIVRAMDELRLLESAALRNPSATIEWVAGLRHGRHSPVVRAEASLALATVGKITYEDLR